MYLIPLRNPRWTQCVTVQYVHWVQRCTMCHCTIRTLGATMCRRRISQFSSPGEVVLACPTLPCPCTTLPYPPCALPCPTLPCPCPTLPYPPCALPCPTLPCPCPTLPYPPCALPCPTLTCPCCLLKCCCGVVIADLCFELDWLQLEQQITLPFIQADMACCLSAVSVKYL